MSPDEPEVIPPAEPRACAKCQHAEAGPGGILCGPCKGALESRTVADWYPPEVAP
jgi:hypothetical protein